jgi:hypothetical protein
MHRGLASNDARKPCEQTVVVELYYRNLYATNQNATGRWSQGTTSSAATAASSSNNNNHKYLPTTIAQFAIPGRW